MPLTSDNLLQKRIEAWTRAPIDPITQEQTKAFLKKSSPEEIQSLFGQTLAFGTGGIRAAVGIGPSRINLYTVAIIARAVALHICENPYPRRIVIGYDCRDHSPFFAQTVASVFADQQFSVSLFQQCCSTPLLSFSARHFTSWAIMVTASHNSPKDNGLKIFLPSGSQVCYKEDQQIADRLDFDSPLALPPKKEENYTLLDQTVDAAYLKALSKAHQKIYPFDPKRFSNNQKPLSILFSNLHGTGARLMKKAIDCSAYRELFDFRYSESQKKPHGYFPTVKSANPEKKEALSIGIKEMQRYGADLLIATDPDADRLGVVCNTRQGVFHLSGDQVAALLLNFQLKNSPYEDCYVVQSVLTCSLIAKIAQSGGARVISTPPGSKWLAKELQEQRGQLILATEPSCGYILYPFVRDKDAHQAALVLCELALRLKSRGKTLLDALCEIYEKHGFYETALIEPALPGGSHLSTMQVASNGKKLLDQILKNPPSHLLDEPVIAVEDGSVPPHLGATRPCQAARLRSASHAIYIRTSGTEAKVKISIQVHHFASRSYCEGHRYCVKKIQSLISQMKEILKNINLSSL